MINNREFGMARRRLGHANHARLRSLGAFIMLGLFAAVPCYGQMGSYTIYSDTWIDASGVNSSRIYNQGEPIPGARVVSWGVTQDNYNYYNHRYWVQTKLTGPGGRTATATSYVTSSYTRAEATLPLTFSESEVGAYQTQSTHSMSCPYMNGIVIPTTTYDLIYHGLSQACHGYSWTSLGVDTYIRVSNCAAKVTCSTEKVYVPSVLNYPNNLLRYEIFLYVGSDLSARFCTGQAALRKAPLGCNSAACRDFPPMPPVAGLPALLQYARK